MNSNLSYSSETLNSGQNRRFFVPCDFEIWHMTLKNNRAPLLCYFKLCASFPIHCWIQTGVTVQKRPIWVKIDVFFSHVTLKFDGWPWKTIGHLCKATSSFVHHFIIICEFKLAWRSETVKLGFDFCELDLWPLTLTSLWSLVVTHKNFMMIQWCEHSEKGVTDRETRRINHS